MNKANELSSKLNQNLYGAKDSIKGLSLMQKINPANKNLGLGLTLVEGNSNFPLSLNTSVFSMISDASKIKRKRSRFRTLKTLLNLKKSPISSSDDRYIQVVGSTA